MVLMFFLDMDDPNTTITSQFGHSSQELINLLLTGQAVSNGKFYVDFTFKRELSNLLRLLL